MSKILLMVNIPQDIILDILVRLPVKPIGRFRCVSKAWFKLLKGGEFVKMHHKNSNEMNKFNIKHYIINEFLIIGFDPSISTCTDLASVNCSTSSWGWAHDPDIVVIWNSCTNEYKKLPLSPSEESINKLSPTEQLGLQVQYGFIYDYKMEDFKVLSLGVYNNRPLCEIHVYTSRSNSWRRLEDIPYDLHNHCGLPYVAREPVNGAIHWKAFPEATGRETEVILSLYMEKELFEVIQMPNLCGGMFRTDICVLNESLCLIASIPMLSRVELWELKDYGVKDSWTKLFNIGHVIGLTPLRSFENGEILFWNVYG
ncbi:F-box protein CPR1-like [Papaver somniferum]|uniref:F-box protein CPR1-like n=1 Tax=Papaver somniferum TaxID=3469 RepID=UPI000E6FB6AF|nr:F-box protein CPR1-like [Papaver somniferum]